MRTPDRTHRPAIGSQSETALEGCPPAKGARRRKRPQNGRVRASRHPFLRESSEHDGAESGLDLNFKVPGPKN